jgi:hypothetical protein
VLHRLAAFSAANTALAVLWVIAGTAPGRRGAMINVREIDHVVLRVVDLERMLAFYGDVLGCPIERRQDEIGLIQLRAGRSLIDLVPVDGALGQSGGAAPGTRRAETSTTSACASSRSTRRRSAPRCTPMASTWARSPRATAPRAKGHRSTCATPKATWSS